MHFFLASWRTLRCVADVPLLFVRPAGGNQRELARQKAAKKQTEQSKGKRNEDGLSAAARKQRWAPGTTVSGPLFMFRKMSVGCRFTLVAS